MHFLLCSLMGTLRGTFPFLNEMLLIKSGFLGEQTLNFLSCKLVKAALTGLDYGETSDLFKCFPELTRWCFHHQKVKPESCRRSVLPSFRQRMSDSPVWQLLVTTEMGTHVAANWNDQTIVCF